MLMAVLSTNRLYLLVCSLDSPYFYMNDISEYPDNVGFISILFDFYRYYAGAANVQIFLYESKL